MIVNHEIINIFRKLPIDGVYGAYELMGLEAIQKI